MRLVRLQGAGTQLCPDGGGFQGGERADADLPAGQPGAQAASGGAGTAEGHVHGHPHSGWRQGDQDLRAAIPRGCEWDHAKISFGEFAASPTTGLPHCVYAASGSFSLTAALGCGQRNLWLRMYLVTLG